MLLSHLNLTNLTSVIKELAHSQSVEDPHVSLICKSNDFGISDGRASAGGGRQTGTMTFQDVAVDFVCEHRQIESRP